MKDILVEMANYNKSVNLALKTLFATTEKDVLSKDCGTFYHSITGTLEHILMAEISWLKRWTTFGEYKSLKSSVLLNQEASEIKKTLTSLDQVFKGLEEIDTLFIDFVDEVTDAEMGKIIKYKNMKGDELQKTFWKTIFHVLNHGTHHRGEISAMLDIQKTSNDFSGFTLYTN